jgi:GxxExxY protein
LLSDSPSGGVSLGGVAFLCVLCGALRGMMTDAEQTHEIIGAAIELHRVRGPGLLESAYEECLAHDLKHHLIPFERQKALPLAPRHVKLDCGYRIDLLVDRRVVIELKAVENLAPIHDAVLLTYLRLSGCSIGLPVNFHTVVLEDEMRRLVQQHHGEGI